jgi:hypothetical protein
VGIGQAAKKKWTDEEIAARLEYPLLLFLKQNTDFFDQRPRISLQK